MTKSDVAHKVMKGLLYEEIKKKNIVVKWLPAFCSFPSLVARASSPLVLIPSPNAKQIIKIAFFLQEIC